MKGIIASASFLIALVVSCRAEAQVDNGPPTAREMQSMLLRSVAIALKARYACIYVTGARAGASTQDDKGNMRVVIDGFAELPGSHAIAPIPANWDVRFARNRREWHVARVSISEAALADALIAARTSAVRDALLDAHPEADRTELARQLSDKGFAIDITGDYQRAEAIAEIAQAIARDGGGDDALARAIWLRGRARDGQDRTDDALADYVEARRLAERSGDLETVAASLLGIGTMTMLKGDDTAGASAVNSALDQALAIGNDRVAATALLILGNRQQLAADFIAALQLYDEAAARAERSGDLLINAAALANSGLVYDRLNNYDLGSRYLRRAIALYRKAGNVRGVIRNLRNLAEVQTQAADLERAAATLREIDQLLRKHFDARVASYCDVTRARIALLRHRRERAQRLAARALRASRNIGDVRLTGYAAQTLAETYRARHHYLEALPLYDEAVRLAKSMNDTDAYWRARVDQADALRNLGRIEEAKAVSLDAIDIAEGISANVPRGGLDQRSFFNDTRGLYREMFRLVAPSDPSVALEWEERGRTCVLLAFLSGGHSIPDSELTERERNEQALIERRLRDANERLLRVRTHPGLDRAHVEELTGAVRRARVERDALTSRLYRGRVARPLPSRADVRRASVEDVRRSIPPDGVILEYVLSGDRVWVIAVTRDHLPSIVAILGDEEALDRKVTRFVALLAGAHPALPSLSRELYDLLVKPVASELHGKKTICIIPDGQLWRLPFQALIADDGRYLIEHHPLFYAPSAAVLTWYESHGQDPAPRTLLAIGNPDLGGNPVKSSKSARRGDTLSPLPDAEREARTVASLYGGTAQLLTGAAATEARFKSLAPQFRILHLATHGSFDDLQPMYSNVILAPGATEDGLFEAREWIDLGIHADLVVLSACQTGRGQAVGGEGVVGMSWALLAAGCPRAVVAQTDVPESTSELMIAFHRELAGRLTHGVALDPRAATEALRDAQLAMLRDNRYAEPFHWAGFMLIGRGW
jgi:CHAT domain-containing protein/tetratricopeptide (TPR) repeat protein